MLTPFSLCCGSHIWPRGSAASSLVYSNAADCMVQQARIQQGLQAAADTVGSHKEYGSLLHTRMPPPLAVTLVQVQVRPRCMYAASNNTN